MSKRTPEGYAAKNQFWVSSPAALANAQAGLMRVLGVATGVLPNGLNRPEYYYVPVNPLDADVDPIVKPLYPATALASEGLNVPEPWAYRMIEQSRQTALDISRSYERPYNIRDDVYGNLRIDFNAKVDRVLSSRDRRHAEIKDFNERFFPRWSMDVDNKLRLPQQ